MNSQFPNLTIHRLRCEYLTNPIGIDERQPRLSWVLSSNVRGQRQTAYQILVSSSPDGLDDDVGDLWDSGKVDSSQSAHVAYRGMPLKSQQRCWWKVRVWDMNGQPSTYSEAMWWEMGLLEAEDWQGRWIGSGITDSPDLQPSPYLRTTFAVKQPIRQARIYATAKGLYELHLNGKRIGDAVLSPGWTDYDRRIQYQTYDVTSQIQIGDNAIGAILGTGWYCGYAGFDKRAKNYGSRPQLLLQLHLAYEDGSEDWVVSDKRWRVTTDGPIRSSDLLMGETYDARRELSGWDTPLYNDTAWDEVAVQPRNRVMLVADCAEPVKITEEIQPKTITQVSDNVYVCDMGQNMVGWVRLKAQGTSGTQITMRFAEMLNPDGMVYTENLREAKQTDVFILNGDGVEIFEPRFTFHGFRYVEITGYPGTPTLDTITGCIVHSATPPAGTLTTSNPVVNQLQQNAVWGQRGNFLSVPTDCPQRNERLGWLGDAQVFIRTACCNMDVAAFFTKWMIDIEDAQSPNGAFPCVAPRLARLEDGCPAWGDAGIIVPWTIYRVYGDTRIILRHWEAMTRWMDYLLQANPGLLWTGRLTRNYGDWLSINGDTPKEVLGTAYFAYDSALMVEMAAAIGRHAEAEQYRRLFEAIQQAFIRAYVAEDGRIEGDTQTVYALALHMNLLPENLRNAAAAHLVEDIASRNWHLSTGFVGVSYLCPVLSQNGYADVALRLLTNETFPSWGYSIKRGATTIWERWDGWTEEKGFQDKQMNSFNHYALGSVGQWLFQSLAGIDLASPGFEHILIRPRIGGGFTYVVAEYESIRGKIACEWEIEDSVLKLSVIIPANTTATVYLPTIDMDSVKEGKSPIVEANGIKFLRQEANCVVYTITSGSYSFTAKFTG
jgi:alpha-L-rhamnosidase